MTNYGGGHGRLRWAHNPTVGALDRKSTRLNSSHPSISYAVFCLKKKIELHPDVRPAQLLDDSGCLLRQVEQIVRPVAVIELFDQEADPLFAGQVFFFNDTATTEIYTLSLHDALPI